MIKFINLQTGKLYSGNIAYKNNNQIDYDNSYIHWLDEAQSTTIIYTKHICFISDNSSVEVNIENNNIFKLLDPNQFDYNATDEVINDIKYKKINDLYIKDDFIQLQGTEINIDNNKYYIYTLYFAISSDNEGEYIQEFKISNNTYLIGADFYIDNEILKINLNNYNLSIPDQIQKSLYPSNVREDHADNILLNRKWKELLSNYWDIVANKGSYKSLINSLKWFEYGDLVKLKEYWKVEDFCKTIYSGKSIKSVLTEKYENLLTNYSKTTYIGLYATLQEIAKNKNKVLYNDELNPVLENISLDISLHDLYLKMSLLGIFYEKYFMPIHLDLIHSTIENIIFTNTVKAFSAPIFSRTDTVDNMDIIIDDVKDIYTIGLKDISVQVDQTVLFNNQYKNGRIYEDSYKIGTDTYANIIHDDDELKTFWTQNYTGPGVIVPITATLLVDNEDDFINFEQISLIPDNTLPSTFFMLSEKEQLIQEKNKWVTLSNHKLYKTNSYFNVKKQKFEINIKFNILCTEERKYKILLMFKSGNCKIYTKYITFNVVCIDNATLDLYKILNGKANDKQITPTGYLFSRKKVLPCKYYSQHILPSNDTGIKLNNIIVFDSTDNSGSYFPDELKNDYDIYVRKKLEYDKNNHVKVDSNNTPIGEIKYTIGISKDFKTEIPENIKSVANHRLIRNDLGFFPRMHHLELIGDKKTLDSYTIENGDTLCVIPNFSFGHLLNDKKSYEWEFENISKHKIIKLPSIQTPYIANVSADILDDGYYNITFKYKLGNIDQQLKINSAFLKVSNKDKLNN